MCSRSIDLLVIWDHQHRCTHHCCCGNFPQITLKFILLTYIYVHILPILFMLLIPYLYLFLFIPYLLNSWLNQILNYTYITLFIYISYCDYITLLYYRTTLYYSYSELITFDIYISQTLLHCDSIITLQLLYYSNSNLIHLIIYITQTLYFLYHISFIILYF